MGHALQVGLVGVPRGYALLPAFSALPGVEVAAVADTDRSRAAWLAGQCGAVSYTRYEDLLDSGVDAVYLGTPMDCHAPQAAEALRRGVHVLSEVPAGVSEHDCRQLTEVASSAKALYMLAENYCYMRSNVVVAAMVRAGLFGQLYYAEGEYLHDCKSLNERTPWRRRWQTGVNGCSYGTHSLGPLLSWFRDERVVAVSCVGSGHHQRDLRGDCYVQEDTVVMLCRLSGGGLVKVRLDMLSDRPAAMTNYALQGVSGSYESARSSDQADRVWLRGRSKDQERWEDLRAYEDEFLPAWWRRYSHEAETAGHGGGDFFETVAFVAAVRGERPSPIDIVRAMDMSLPGIVSQRSIAEGGAWIEVPDPRAWLTSHVT